jgi:hypothetical protein
MNIPAWIDVEYVSIGTIGYLVETVNTSTGGTSWSLYDRPPLTNRSHEPRLYGWLGETDNRSRTARGMVRVTALNKNRDRARIARLTGDELSAALEGDGYPELANEAP